MSKSLGNVVRIRDALKDYSAQELRLYFAGFHYREPVVMTTPALKKARITLKMLSKELNTFRECQSTQKPLKNKRLNQLTTKFEKDFRQHMNDDFDTPNALKDLLSYVAYLSSYRKSKRIDVRSKERVEAVIQRISNVIGISI